MDQLHVLNFKLYNTSFDNDVAKLLGKACEGKCQDADFKLDIKVGYVESCEPLDENYLSMTVNMGKDKRKIISNCLKGLKKEDLDKSLVLVLTNIEPKKIKEVKSMGVIFYRREKEKLLPVRPNCNARPGDKVFPSGCEEPKNPGRLSNEDLEKVTKLLKTTDDGEVFFGDKKLRTDKGFLTTKTDPSVFNKEFKEEKKDGKKEKQNELFAKVELKVGYVENCENLDSDNYSLTVNLGNGEKRKIGSGCAKTVSVSDINQSLVVVFTNTPKRKIKDLESAGFIMCQKKEDKLLLVRPNGEAKPGDRVFLENGKADNNKVPEISKEDFDAAVKHFCTSEQGHLLFNAIKLKTDKGYLTTNTDKSVFNKQFKEEKKHKEDKKDNKKGGDDLFSKVDLRVGYVEECTVMEGFKDIYSLVVDLNEDEKRKIGTGLRNHVPIDKIKHTKCIVFSNLKPKKFGKDGFESNGMIVCASSENKETIELIRPHEDAKPGDKVYLEGTELDPKKVDQLSNKNFDKVLKKLFSNDKGEATFDGVRMMTDKGVITTTLKNAHIS